MDPRVLEAMLPYFGPKFGNAASRTHRFGWEAEKAVDNARKQIADLIGTTSKENIFTSGATESDNLAIKGAAEFHKDRGNHVITAMGIGRRVKEYVETFRRMGIEERLIFHARDREAILEAFRLFRSKMLELVAGPTIVGDGHA